MTEQEKYVLSAAATFRDCLKLLDNRSKKYGGNGRPFDNFEYTAELADGDAMQGIIFRLGDKMGRIRQGLRNFRDGNGGPAFADESLNDSLLDAINYITILRIYLETGGGDSFDAFLENSGMIAPAQPRLPLADPEALEAVKAVEETHTPESNWFKKFVGK